MAFGDLEFPLRGKHTKQLQHWASTWLDLIQVGQMIHTALGMTPSDMAANIYTRRALLDDALVTYGRLFNSGRRQGTVDLMPWIVELGAESVALHQEALRWRNKHIAHRDDEDLERAHVSLLWENFGTSKAALRLRLESTLTPDDDLAKDIQAMAYLLQCWIWERALWPRQQDWLAVLGPAGVEAMRTKARVFGEPKDTVPRAIRATQDIGSERPRPTKPYRRLPSRTKRTAAHATDVAARKGSGKS